MVCRLPIGCGQPPVSLWTFREALVAQARASKRFSRGARGILVRIGRILWGSLLENASFSEKTQAQIARSLPPSMRLKATLELLAGFLRDTSNGVTVHTLDTDLMLADHAGAGQKEDTAICMVTLGMLEEALFWASGHEYDVTEVSCRAAGSAACEFKVLVSG